MFKEVSLHSSFDIVCILLFAAQASKDSSLVDAKFRIESSWFINNKSFFKYEKMLESILLLYVSVA